MKINKQQQQEINVLLSLSDDEIDYSDIPDNSDISQYTRMNNKQFNQFIKSDTTFNEFIASVDKLDHNMVTVNMRFNKEVVDFFKEHSTKYQVKINEALLMLVHQYKHLKH